MAEKAQDKLQDLADAAKAYSDVLRHKPNEPIDRDKYHMAMSALLAAALEYADAEAVRQFANERGF